MTATTTATRQSSGSSSSHQAATTPTMLPNVPGAFGARPAPKPNAMKWTGSRSVPTFVLGLGNCSCIALSRASLPASEVPVAAHGRRERLAITAAHEGLARDELADAAHRRACGFQRRLDLLGPRRRSRETK